MILCLRKSALMNPWPHEHKPQGLTTLPWRYQHRRACRKLNHVICVVYYCPQHTGPTSSCVSTQRVTHDYIGSKTPKHTFKSVLSIKRLLRLQSQRIWVLYQVVRCARIVIGMKIVMSGRGRGEMEQLWICPKLLVLKIMVTLMTGMAISSRLHDAGKIITINSSSV